MKDPYNAEIRFIEENIEKGLGDKTAIFFEDREYSFLDVKRNVNQFGAALTDLNVEHENRVILLLNDSPEFVFSFFGSIKVGAIPIPLNTLGTPKDYIYYLNHSRAKVLVVHREHWEKIKDYKDEFVYLKQVILVTDETDATNGSIITYGDFINGKSDSIETFYSTEDDQAFWLYTSGSTGKPKGVIHIQGSMEYALDNFAKKILQIKENDVTLSAAKLFFAYGLGNGMYFPLGTGASTVLMRDKPTPESVFEAIEKYKPTIFFGVPTLYGSMLDYADRAGVVYDLSSIRICVSAGEKLPSNFVNKWKEKYNLDILDGIGSTEALHIYLSNTTEHLKPGSTGRLVPGYDAKIVNENLEPVADNEVGELVIKGNSITTGFWSNINENRRKLHGEWMYTGDQYSRDEDGFYWYHGRSDDMMKVGGIWVSPIEIESVLINHDDILEVAVIGSESSKGLMKPKAYVVLKDGIVGDDDKRSELINYVRSNLAKHKFPREIIFLDSLPKTTSGKIQRFKLKSMVLN